MGAIKCLIPWAFVLSVILESYGTALPQSRPGYLAPSLMTTPPTTYDQHHVTQKPHFSMKNDTAMAGLPTNTVLPFEEEDWVRVRHFFHFLRKLVSEMISKSYIAITIHNLLFTGLCE